MKYFLVLYISIAALLGGLANAAKIHQMKDSEAKQIQPCEEKVGSISASIFLAFVT